MIDLDRELDRLFGLALGEFTSARNDLAKKLTAEKATAAAAEIRALPKPTVPAWTINQLSRVDRAGVQALLAAGEALRAAQASLLRSEDAGRKLREASAEERAAGERLTERSQAVLKEAGRPATAAVLDRVSATLRAAAVTDDGRRLLERGRLTVELEPPGFDAFTAGRAEASPRRRPSRGRDELAERRRQRHEQQQRRKELREAARAAERVARTAEREAERAEAAAAEARLEAERARAEADAAAAASDERREGQV